MSAASHSVPPSRHAAMPVGWRRLAGRLSAVVLASLTLHVVVLTLAQRQIDVELPPPPTVVQAELFVLPAPIAVAAPARPVARASRAITPPPPTPPIVAEEPRAAATDEATPTEPVAQPDETRAQEPTAADDPATGAVESPLDAVVVNFPKYGRFTSETLAARGLLRMLGTTVIEWRVREDRYQARSEVTDDSGQVWMTLTSEGEVRPSAGIAPVRYTEKSRNRAEVATNFQWDTGKVTFSSTNAEFALVEGAQDQLSFLAQLALLAEAFPQHFQPGGAIAMQVATRRDLRVYDMRVIGWEAIRTAAGVYDTLKLDRLIQPEVRDARIEVWLAPALRWLPARTRTVLPNGDLIETSLTEVSFEEPLR